MKPLIDHPYFDAVCSFLEQWDPETGAPRFAEYRKDFNSRRLGFQLLGVSGFVHDLPEVQKAWADVMPDLESDKKAKRHGTCLITGKNTPITLVHPPVTGIFDPGGQAEKALVSFNCDAYTSYGLLQSQNAPSSLEGAWGYVSALNYLLTDRGIVIGDMTVSYWADESSPLESVFGNLFSGLPDSEAEDSATKQQLEVTIKAIRQGAGNLDVLNANPSSPFYVLGVSPASSRIAVRFWLVSSLGQLLQRLHEHYQDLQIVREFDNETEFLAVWQLLRGVLPYREGYRPKNGDIPPLLAGALMRAILNGTPYPDSLASAVIRRIRADRTINYCRAAILKAWLTRLHRTQGGIPVSLDTERTEPAYRLGRLFAVLEKTQEDAQPGINATIRERFYSAASATPSMVFPRLLRTYQHHLAKLVHGAKINREKLVQEIVDGLETMPPHLNLEAQALFAIGYYHQRKALYTSSRNQESDNDNQE